MSRFLLILLSILFFFVVPTKVSAVTVSISNYPSNITSEPFNITVSIEGAQAGANYIRVDLYKDGSTNYFGETYNGSVWYKDSDGKQYFPVTIASGVTWSGTVQAKVGSPNSSEYDGTGQYRIRVRRYTESGNQGSEDANSSSVAIAVVVPTPTPTPAPTNVPTSSPIPTNSPTPTKSPSATPTKSPTIVSAKATSPTIKLTQKKAGEDDLFLAGETQIAIDSPTPEANAQVLGENTSKQPFIFLGLGVIILLVSGIFAYIQLGDKIFIWKKKSS